MPTDRRTTEQDDQLLALMGLGARSGKKSHYPELKRRLAELERVQALLDRAQDAIFVVSLPDETVEYRNEAPCPPRVLRAASRCRQCLAVIWKNVRPWRNS